MPLPKNKWAALPKSQRGKLTYQQYVKWTKKTTAARAKAAAGGGGTDPFFGGVDFSAFAPLSQKAITAQARATANAATQPLITEIQNAIARQRRAGIADINAATGQSIKAVAPLAGQIGGDYNQAIQQTNAANQFLSNFERGVGTQAQQDISSQLAASGLPTPSTGNLAALGQGAAAAAAAGGTTTLDALIGERANRMAYAQSLPSSYKAMGAQNIGKFSRTMADNLATQIGQVSQQVPGLVQSTYQNLLEREYNKAVARTGFQMDIGKSNLSAAAAGQSASTKAALAAGKINPGVSNGLHDGYAHTADGSVATDANGNPLPWVVPKKGGTSGSITPKSEQARLDKVTKDATKIARDLHVKMMTTLTTPRKTLQNPIVGERVKGGAAANVVAWGRHNATVAVVNYLEQNYPGKSDAWINQRAAAILASSGWPRAGKELTTGGQPTTGRTAPPAVAGGGVSPAAQKASGELGAQARKYASKTYTPEGAYAEMVKQVILTMRKYKIQLPKEQVWKAAQYFLSRVRPDIKNTASMGDPRQYEVGYSPPGRNPTTSTGYPQRPGGGSSPGALVPTQPKPVRPQKGENAPTKASQYQMRVFGKGKFRFSDDYGRTWYTRSRPPKGHKYVRVPLH